MWRNGYICHEVEVTNFRFTEKGVHGECGDKDAFPTSRAFSGYFSGKAQTTKTFAGTVKPS